MNIYYLIKGVACDQNINECASNPCLNGGTCVDGINMFTCTCPQYYNGTNCGTPINICTVANPCLNNATCTNGLPTQTIQCVCAPGYYGSTCASFAQVCASAPCLNGGVCIPSSNNLAYTCNCTKNFTGSNCSTRNIIDIIIYFLIKSKNKIFFFITSIIAVNYCANNPCGVGGVCSNNYVNNSFSCACYSGYNGPTCSNRNYSLNIK